MEQSIEGLCNQLARYRLLDAATIRALRQRWRTEAKDAADVAQFSKWLAANRALTDFQAELLARGIADQLVLGEYLLVERIGQGRMAGVYKAVHPQTGQPVAVKVLPPSKANHPHLLARFQREARLAMRLKHVNVVRTFQRGQTPAGLHYLVMELLDGETLEDVLERRGQLPVEEAVHVACQTLQGLQHLFEEGMVHRDLKPANLMLVPGRQPGEADSTLPRVVKVLDIGLGRALFDESGAGPAEGGELTSEGTLLGTPNFMAPEQARSAHSADIRSDIYSLGCILYQTLTGRPPFPDSSFMRQMVRHATEPPQPLRQLNPAVPDTLQAVVDMLLAKDPAQRFATPAQAIKALKSFEAAVPELPRAPEAEPRLRSYLTWLETNVQEAEDGEAVAAPVASVVPAATVPPVTTLSPPPPASESAAPPPPAVPQGFAEAATLPPAAAVAPTRSPIAVAEAASAPVATLAVPVLRQASSDSRPTPGVSAPARLWALVRDSTVWAHRHLQPHLQRLNLTRRDWIAAGVGAGVLLVLEVIVWLLSRLFRGLP